MKPVILAGALASFALPAFAQDHSAHMAPAGEQSAATTAFKDANMRMHENMDIDYTGDPDVDFILSMLPHHQGAVDMARIVLENGKDPEVRKLAQDIVAAQEAEMVWMKQWLAKNGQADQ